MSTTSEAVNVPGQKDEDLPPLEFEQKRFFVRVTLSLPATMICNTDGHCISSTILNLSEGGVKISTPERLEAQEDDLVNMSFAFDIDQPVLHYTGRVIRCWWDEEIKRTLFSFSFVGLEPKDEDKIRAAVFSHLRDQRARRLR